MFKKIIKFFDKLEDRVRAVLSRHVIVYALVGGVAIVLFWRGIWKMADDIGLSGEMSVLISTITLLLSGLFVSFFVGDRIVLSGLKREKKLVEKTEEEIKADMETTKKILEKMEKIEKDIEEIKTKLTK